MREKNYVCMIRRDQGYSLLIDRVLEHGSVDIVATW